MNEAKNQDDPVLVDHVVDDAVVAYPEPVERVSGAAYRLDPLAATFSSSLLRRQSLKGRTDRVSNTRRQGLVDPGGIPPKSNLVVRGAHSGEWCVRGDSRPEPVVASG